MSKTRVSHLSAVLGIGEKRREAYSLYGERVSERATTQCAKSISSVASFASQQTGTVRGLV